MLADRELEVGAKSNQSKKVRVFFNLSLYCNLRGAAVFVTVDRSLAVLGILVEDKEDDSVAAVAAHRLCVAGRAARVPAPHQPAV